MTPAQTVRQFLKAMEALDYDAGLQLVSADCAYTNPPPLGTVHGPAGIRAVLADKWVELPVTGVFEVHDGLITYWRDYFDAATILSAWPAA